MLLHLADMPTNIKLCKILAAEKIQRKSTLIDDFPKDSEELRRFNDRARSLNQETQDGKQKIPGEALVNTCWRMIKACLSDDGIGLAAPQLGIFKRVIIIRENELAFKVYFHPRFTVDSDSVPDLGIEGCLSVPGRRVPVIRATKICAEWLEFDSTGQLRNRTSILEGLKARVFQHEYDHLEGISILNRQASEKSFRQILAQTI